ncbi:hypothetical protein Tco_0273334 [Tanacetum coccineum]
MVETASGKLVTPSGSTSDRVRKVVMASRLSDNELEDEIEGVEEEEEEEEDLEYFDIFPTMEELGYHKWLLKSP